MPDSRVLQIGTVHHLGTHFTKAFDYKIQKKDGTLDYPHQTSYGVSDRVVAASIAINGDDHGPVLNPYIAPIKVVVIPIPAKTEEETEKVFEYAREITKVLNDAGIKAVIDEDRDKTPGEKFYVWELKGVPIRAEVGPRELKEGTVFLKRRDTFEGRSVKKENLVSEVNSLMREIYENLKKRAWEFLNSKIRRANTLDEAKKLLEAKAGVVEVPWCGRDECGLKLEDELQARVLGSPVGEVKVEGKCVVCGNEAKSLLRVAKTY